MNRPVQKRRPRATAARAPQRSYDPERTMADILNAAMREFAERGFAGARVEEIARATRTSKRMLYYYFSSKEGLYLAALEEAYRRMRQLEADLHLEDLPPEDALRKLVGHTVDYQYAHPDFLRLVMNENILRGEFIRRSRTIQSLNVPAIDRLRAIYERGVAEGVFRSGLDPIDLHMSISALSVFNVANKYTFSLIFKRDLDAPGVFVARRDAIIEMVVRFVRRSIQP
ncbi:MAG: TetR family transcriptional regulator [Burkholderiaceae bacterium]|nr:TetR family transcriptional regulator [Burkholderiaceae bacterium]